ncbi:organomercurial lyase [Natronoarchaeum mannanilyticum]|uniref:Alkylmercury lyase n=1 Tax=Natronoarchaeum mannanilyticum TaxID=926360 RepID=A0AAV3TAL7_9EURY
MADSNRCECCSDRIAIDDTDPGRAPTADPPVPVEDAMATPIPDDVGAAMEGAYDLDAPPATIAEWLDGVLAAYRAAGETVTADDMCAVDDARHEVELDGGAAVPGTDAAAAEYICVLDPLAVPFIDGTAGTVRSESPVSDATIEFRVSPSEISVDPETAVVSLGIDAEDDDTGSASELTFEDTYELLCPYGHAFRDEAAYERWDAERDGIATMSLDAETAVGVAVGIARRLDAAE